MRNKTDTFMEILQSFFDIYMPYSAGLSDNTIHSYKYAFRLLLEYMFVKRGIPADKVTFKLLDYNTVNSFLIWLEEERGCTVFTRNQRLAALSSFAAYAQNQDLEAASVFMHNLKKIPVKKQKSGPRTVFSLNEVTALLQIPDERKYTGRRDKVLLNFMYASGARAQEVCDLRVRDIQKQKNQVRITLIGKGNKSRRIIMAKQCGEILCQYLSYRKIENRPNSHVFSSQTHEQMTISCIEGIFKKYVQAAKQQNPDMFLEAHYSPHTMRHTTATHMLEAGIPIIAIKNFLGHTSVATTQRYAELSQGTVNKHIKEWNEKWFPKQNVVTQKSDNENIMPDFLN